jgi:ubiquitin-like protein ATG12
MKREEEETTSNQASTHQQNQQANSNDSSSPTTLIQTPPSSTSSTAIISNNPKKIKVHLVAVGSAPILKKNKFLMNRTDNFGVAIAFLRRRLKLDTTAAASALTGSSVQSSASSASLFLYVNSAFVPSPTEQIGDLYDCFGMREELVIHYSLQEAWG